MCESTLGTMFLVHAQKFITLPQRLVCLRSSLTFIGSTFLLTCACRRFSSHALICCLQLQPFLRMPSLCALPLAFVPASSDTFVIFDAFTFHSPCLADRLLQLGQHSVDVSEIAQLGGGGRGEDVGVGTYKHGIHTLCLSSDFINLCKLHMCKWSLLSSYSSSLPILEL